MDFQQLHTSFLVKNPPNWCKLWQDNSESVTDEKYDLAETWYLNEATFETHEVHHDISNDNNCVHPQPSEDLRESSQTSENLRESDTINVHNKDDSDSSKPTEPIEFVDLANVGLRRGARKKKPTSKLKDSCSKEVSNIKRAYGLMVIANDIKETLHNSGRQSYYTFLEGYDEYLDLNVDGTQNSMSILGNIYLSGKINNEIYTLKEMIQQPDRKHRFISQRCL